MTKALKDMTDRARFLRNAAPQPFDDFIAAFEIYTREAIDYLVLTTADFPVAQGRAQQCQKILDTLKGVRNG